MNMILDNFPLLKEEENKYEYVGLMSAQASIGIGLLTSIAMFFCNVFGGESYLYTEKIGTVKMKALERLIEIANKRECDRLTNINFVMDGLSVIAYGTGLRLKKEFKEADEVSNIDIETLEHAEKDMLTDEYVSKCNKYTFAKRPSNFLENVLFYLVSAKCGLTANQLIAKDTVLITNEKLINTEKNGLIENKDGKYYVTDEGFKFLDRINLKK